MYLKDEQVKDLQAIAAWLEAARRVLAVNPATALADTSMWNPPVGGIDGLTYSGCFRDVSVSGPKATAGDLEKVLAGLIAAILEMIAKLQSP